MFSITEFKSNLKIVRPNLFYAEVVNGPTTFKYRCESTELPGRTVATSDDQAAGPTRKFAYEITYNDINMQIVASEDMRERFFFEAWMDGIVNPANSILNISNSGGLVRYYDDYARGRQINIYQLNDLGATIIGYKLHNAFPIQIAPMGVSWEEQNTYQRFAITISYRYHEVINPNNTTTITAPPLVAVTT